MYYSEIIHYVIHASLSIHMLMYGRGQKWLKCLTNYTG